MFLGALKPLEEDNSEEIDQGDTRKEMKKGRDEREEERDSKEIVLGCSDLAASTITLLERTKRSGT